MAGPIATLAVRLSAQLAEFQTSFKDATKTVDAFKTDFDQFASKITGTIDGVSKAFQGFGANLATVGLAVAGVAAAGGAAILAFKGIEAAVSTVAGVLSNALKSTADLGDQFFTLANQTGLSVESLSGFKFAAAQTGTSLDAITGAVFKLEANLGKGGKATEDAIKGIGLSLSSLKAQAPEDAFKTIIDKLATIPNAADRAAAGVALFGKSFKDVAVLAAEGKGGLKALTDQAEALGVVMSTKTAVAADRFHDGLGAIAAAAEGITQQLGAKLLPAAVAFTEVFGKIFIDAVKGIVSSTKGAGEAFDRFVVFVGEAAARFLEVLAKMVDGVAEWAVSITKRIADQAKAFLDLSPAIISVGRALDLALGGGTHQTAFDALEANLASLKAALPAIEAGAATAGAAVRTVAQGIATAAKDAGSNFGATFARIQTEIAASAAAMRENLKGVAGGLTEGGDSAFKSFEKSLLELTQQIDRAAAHGTPLAELVRLFGDEASKSAAKADAWGISVKQSVERVAAAFESLAAKKEILAIVGDIDALDRRLKAFSTKEMQDEMRDLAKISKDSIDSIAKRLDTFGADIERQWRDIDQVIGTFPGFGMGLSGIGFTSGQIASFALFGQKAGKEFSNAFQRASANFAQQLPQALQTAVLAMQGGNTVGAVSGFGAALGAAFVETFAESAKRAADGGAAVTIGETLAGRIGTGLVAFAQGAQFAQQMGKFAGSISGAIAGGLQGFALAGPVGGAIGLTAGLLGGAIGPNALETEQKGVRASQTNLAAQLGGTDKIQALAQKSPELAAALNRAFSTVEVSKFNKAVADVNESLAAYQAHLKGLDQAQTAVNARTKLYTAQFGDLIAQRTALLAGRPPELLSGDEGKKLAELQAQIGTISARTQPEFERLGVIVRSTFAGIVKETGDGFAAIQALAPSFQALKDGVTEFGAGSTPVIDKLLGQFDLINSEITGPFLQNVQTSGQILRGLFDAKSLDASGFQALAADIGQSLQEVANRGGDMSQAFALSQPVLQALFEAEQQFGQITDDTSEGILRQAEAQGIVGNQFKSTQEKTLEVLLAIADVFGAKIPAGIAATAAAATTAGATIGTAFSNGVDAAGASVGGFADKIRTQIPPAAIEAGNGMRQVFEAQAAAAADAVARDLSDAATEGGAAIEFKVGRSLAGLKGTSQTAADDISKAFGRIKVPEITVPAKIELDSSALDRIPDDVRIQTGFDTSGIPSFGTGAIVHKRTLAFIGESGPEAVVPLPHLPGARPAPATGRPVAGAVTFAEGSVIINGPVDSDERARQVVRDFARAVRKGGDSRTLALRTLGLERI
jgi:hypothetical protein